MTTKESRLVALVLGILCPLSLFALCWWIAAVLALNHVLRIPEGAVAIAALAGLGIGITLDILWLRNWTARVYNLDMRILAFAYLFWSATANAAFMGLPLGNIVLGMLAGVYVGRRKLHARVSTDSFARAARNVSIFTALVTGIEQLPIGLMALREPVLLECLRARVGLEQSTLGSPVGIGLVGLACAALMAIQFWFTRFAARLSFRPSKNTV